MDYSLGNGVVDRLKVSVRSRDVAGRRREARNYAAGEVVASTKSWQLWRQEIVQ
jgi:hypothetical protein